MTTPIDGAPLDPARIGPLLPMDRIQQDVVEAPPGPVFMMGGTGTGKGHVLAARAVRLGLLLGEPQPVTIFALNNRAGRPVRDQVQAWIGDNSGLGQIYVRTFEEFCADLMRRLPALGYPISGDLSFWDQSHSARVLREVIQENRDSRPAETMADNLGRLLVWINDVEGLTTDTVDQPPVEKWAEYRRAYLRIREEQRAYDRASLLVAVYHVLADSPEAQMFCTEQWGRHVMVDGFEDINEPQYLLMTILAGPEKSVTVAMDPNQAIFHWRGALHQPHEAFLEDFPDALRKTLLIDHRASGALAEKTRGFAKRKEVAGLEFDAASAVRPQGRSPVPHTARGYPGNQYRLIARHIKDTMLQHGPDRSDPRDIAVLARRRAPLLMLARALDVEGVPYAIAGDPADLGDPDARAVLGVLTLAINPRSAPHFREVCASTALSIRRRLHPHVVDQVVQAAREHDHDLLLAIEHVSRQFAEDALPARHLRAVANTIRALRSELRSHDAAMLDILESARQGIYSISGADRPRQASEDAARAARVAQLVDGQAARTNETGNEVRDGRHRVLEFLAQFNHSADPDIENTARRAWRSAEDGRHITLATIHAAKGLEWQAVYIADAVDHVIPGYHVGEEPRQMWHEQRLFYQAVTRARDHCFIISPKTRIDGSPAEQSRFTKLLFSDQ